MKSPLSLKGRTAEILNVFKGGYGDLDKKMRLSQ